MKTGKRLLAAILCVIVIVTGITVFGAGDKIKGAQDMRFGIDIRGGVEAIFEPEGLSRKATAEELEIAKNIIEVRLDGKNITDREVTVDKDDGYIIVRFPWKSDESSFNPEDAIAELGEMALLTFRDEAGNVMVEGKHIKNAEPMKDTTSIMNGYEVSLTFDGEGAKLFETATGNLVGKQMGIYMDDQMISNPMVQSQISGGKATINNMASFEEAQNLAQKINSGALPFSLKTSNFNTISPTLGSNALDIMVMAGIAAFIMVCVFMIAYYRLLGIIACLTLLLQMSLQLLSISIPQFTLTLPGIAGIILSLGMAVDANIIISERIAEDLPKGLSIRSAVKGGYKNAFSSVLDGNLTTAIVAVILMIFGSGTMLSFGYTLLMGMLLNLFVGVTISRWMILSVLDFKKLNDIKLFKARPEIKLRHFYNKKKIVAGIAVGVLLLCIIGSAVFGVRLDTQFTGGAVLKYSVDGEVILSDVEKELKLATDRPVTLQITENRMDSTKNLVVTLAGTRGLSPEEQKAITASVEMAVDNGKGVQNQQTSQVSLAQTYAVEPYIGAKALKNSQIAIGLAMVFMVIYVWIRFSVLGGLPAGITAIIALLHDVFVVFAVFVIFRIPLNDAFVAVVLTIIGYSINDTIVIYDRIRENRKLSRKTKAPQLIDSSISQTLARSINTSLTTGMCVLIILAAAAIFDIGSIVQFALPMLFGLISGCYSSIFIAGILWAYWQQRDSKKRVV